LLCASSVAASRKKAKAKDGRVQQAALRSSSDRRSSDKHKKSRRKGKSRGQQKIDAQRAYSIQEALIREHYLEGQPSGVWDNKSQKAMERFQSDNGWQTKVVPDSRALIKLGLGPDQHHLLNPESAMTAGAARPSAPAAVIAPPVPSEPRSASPPQ